jgi:hypothetical protein
MHIMSEAFPLVVHNFRTGSSRGKFSLVQKRFILFSLGDGEKHGHAIKQHCSQLSNGESRIGPATPYDHHPTAAGVGGDRRSGKLLLEAESSRMREIMRLARRREALAHGTK